MEFSGQDREARKDRDAEPGVGPAVMTWMACLAGTVGAVLIAAGPWLVLGYYL